MWGRGTRLGREVRERGGFGAGAPIRELHREMEELQIVVLRMARDASAAPPPGS